MSPIKIFQSIKVHTVQVLSFLYAKLAQHITFEYLIFPITPLPDQVKMPLKGVIKLNYYWIRFDIFNFRINTHFWV